MSPEFFSTADMLDQMRERGCTFRLQDGAPRVKFSTACPPTPGLLEELAKRRAEIIEVLQGQPEGSEFGARVAQVCRAAEAEAEDRAALGRARMLIQRVREAGGRIALKGTDTISVTPPPDAETAQALRATKGELLILLVREQAEMETAG